jgi:hypothetical protein
MTPQPIIQFGKVLRPRDELSMHPTVPPDSAPCAERYARAERFQDLGACPFTVDLAKQVREGIALPQEDKREDALLAFAPTPCTHTGWRAA